MGIKFIEADILDEKTLKHNFRCRYYIRLAGITDVAYVKNDKLNNEDEIIKVGIEGTRNIINLSKDEVKIVFPSSHVVYEGYKETLNLINILKRLNLY